MIVDIEVPNLTELAGDIRFAVGEEGGQADQAIITNIYFEKGDRIEEGELFALIENSYGTYEIVAPVFRSGG